MGVPFCGPIAPRSPIAVSCLGDYHAVLIRNFLRSLCVREPLVTAVTGIICLVTGILSVVIADGNPHSMLIFYVCKTRIKETDDNHLSPFPSTAFNESDNPKSYKPSISASSAVLYFKESTYPMFTKKFRNYRIFRIRPLPA